MKRYLHLAFGLFLLLGCPWLILHLLQPDDLTLRPKDDLDRAIIAGDIVWVKGLLRAGYSVNRKGNDGKTPLMVAVVSGQPAVAKYLLSHGADFRVRDRFGMTALQYVTWNLDGEDYEVLNRAGAKE